MRPALLISAFLAGAIAPLLSVLFAAFIGGCWYANSRQLRLRRCDPELYAQIQDWTEAERQKLRLK